MSTAFFYIVVCGLFRSAGPLFVATFTVPENITTSTGMMLWLLPLAAAVATIYKVLKLPEIKPVGFIKETGILFGSIIVFLAVSAIVLFIVAWLFV
jgi:hypothetical protein